MAKWTTSFTNTQIKQFKATITPYKLVNGDVKAIAKKTIPSDVTHHRNDNNLNLIKHPNGSLCWRNLKKICSIATRFDKLKQSYENNVALACAYFWFTL